MEKNDFCKNCAHWNYHKQFCKKLQTYPEDIQVCTMRELVTTISKKVMNMTEKTINDLLETWNNRYKKHAKHGDVRLALAVEQCIQELRHVHDLQAKKER